MGTNIGVYRSQNLGVTWKQIKQGLFDQNIRALSLHPDFPRVIYAGAALGIFKSEDEGETWNEWIDQSFGQKFTIFPLMLKIQTFCLRLQKEEF